ncbi:unnamed protein product [Ixodes pacificus]
MYHECSLRASPEPTAASVAFLLVQAGYGCQLVFDYRLYRDRGLSAADMCALAAIQLLCLLSGPWLARALRERLPKRLLVSCLVLCAVSCLCKTWFPAATVAQALALSVAAALLDLEQRLAAATHWQTYVILVAWSLAAVQTELLKMDAKMLYPLAALLYAAAALQAKLKLKPGTCRMTAAVPSASTAPTVLNAWMDSLAAYLENSACLCSDVSIVCIETVYIVAWVTFPALADESCFTVMDSLGMALVLRLSIEQTGRTVSEFLGVSGTWRLLGRQLGYCLALVTMTGSLDPRSPFAPPLDKGIVCGSLVMFAFGVGVVLGPRDGQGPWQKAAAGLLSSGLLVWPVQSEELQFESALAWAWPLLLVGFWANAAGFLLASRTDREAPPAPRTRPC